MKQLKACSLKSLRNSKGFTLVELLVTLSIIVLATGLVMVRYASFNSTVLLNSLAYDIAFDIRETQSLAISIRGGEAGFREEYGMHFDLATSNQYLLFQDTNQTLDDDDGIYFDSEAEAVGDPIIIDPRFTIVDLCGTDLGGARACHSDQGYPSYVTVAFARPDFNAVIHNSDTGPLSEAEIVLGTGDEGSDITRTVLVSSSGQITVK